MSVDEIKSGVGEAINSDGKHDELIVRNFTDIITRIASIIIGLLILVILILIPIIVTLEIVYLCFPITREKTDEFLIKLEGNGILQGAVGVTLRDAREAVERANTIETGKSAMLIYLGLKMKSTTFAMYILCLVAAGSGPVVNAIANMVRPLIDLVF